MYIYADESGDLGWKFGAPYGKGGSSRYLVIFAVCVHEEKDHRIDRVIRDLYTASRWDPKKEKKWIHANSRSRQSFVESASKLCESHPDISYHAIAVYKPNVQTHLRADPNKLYNYMLKLLLLSEMSRHQEVLFMPDARSVRVASGDSLHDYLQTELWYEANAKTRLTTLPRDSRQHKGLQFADMMAGAVSNCFEFGDRHCFDHVERHVRLKRLFFPC